MQWIIPLIVVAIFVFRILKGIEKKNSASNPQPSNSQNSSVQQAFDQLLGSLGQSNNQRSHPGDAAPPIPTATPPVRKTLSQLRKEHVARVNNHFSEEKLVQDYIESHKKGKTLSHHTHDYFDEKKDRHFSGSSRAMKKEHPLSKLLKSEGGLKQAIILSEIINRPHYK